MRAAICLQSALSESLNVTSALSGRYDLRLNIYTLNKNESVVQDSCIKHKQLWLDSRICSAIMGNVHQEYGNHKNLKKVSEKYVSSKCTVCLYIHTMVWLSESKLGVGTKRNPFGFLLPSCTIMTYKTCATDNFDASTRNQQH